MKSQKNVRDVVAAILSHSGFVGVYSDVKALFVEVEDAMGGDNGFNVDFDGREYRVIANDDIASVMADELSGDEYVLGCFSAYFLSDIIGIPSDAVQKIQNADGFEALGMIITADKGMLWKLVDGYIRADGAGHHFSSYDGSETDAGDFSVFCVN